MTIAAIGQLRLAFAQTYSMEEIGVLVNDRILRLHTWFLIEVLGAQDYYLYPKNPDEPPTNAVIQCPFCEQEGRLILKRVEPINYGSAEIHIGNLYFYGCTSPGCEGEFVGQKRVLGH